MSENRTAQEQYPFQDEDLFLVTSYKGLAAEKERLKKLLDGSWIYTIDMAIEELDNIAVSYESERVQSSIIGNPTERIVLRINEPGYMDRKQRQLNQAKKQTEKDYDFICWLIDLIETALRERMEQRERTVFKKSFFEGWTYKHLRESVLRHTLKPINNRQIQKVREEGLLAIAQEIEFRDGLDDEHTYVARLIQETAAAMREREEA